MAGKSESAPHNNPVIWYAEAFKKANFILVFASPNCRKSVVPHWANPYLHLDTIAEEKLDLELSLSDFNSKKKRIAFCILPECEVETIPDRFRREQRRLRTFVLPDQIESLLRFLGLPALMIPKGTVQELQDHLNKRGVSESERLNQISFDQPGSENPIPIPPTTPLIPAPASSPVNLSEYCLSGENRQSELLTRNVQTSNPSSSGIDENVYKVEDMRL